MYVLILCLLLKCFKVEVVVGFLFFGKCGVMWLMMSVYMYVVMKRVSVEDVIFVFCDVCGGEELGKG